MTPRRCSTALFLAGLTLCQLLIALPAPADSNTPRGSLPSNRPNILILVSDDQTWSNFTRELMPNVFSQLVDKGVEFTRAYDETGLCCPARSEIFTGLYEHDTGVDDNFVPLNRPSMVEALHDLGYRTSLTGKYLNSAPCDPRPEYDQWVCAGEGESDYSLKNPTLNVNGQWVSFPGQYQTDVLAQYTADFINGTPTTQPFFALYTPTSPHLPANDDRCSGIPVQQWRPPSYDEDTVLDGKPVYMQRGALSPTEVQWNDQAHKVMTQVVSCLDTSIGTVLNALAPREQETLVFFISDNGYFYGEHRRWDKRTPYEEAVHVPMVVRYPPIVPEGAPFSSSALVENVDIAATIAEVLQIHWGADGLSMVPLLDQQSASIRDAALLEDCMGASYPCAPPLIPFEQALPPSMTAVVTSQYKYVELSTGERELYDFAADPSEMTNLHGDPGYAQQEADLAGQLAALLAPPPTDTTVVTGPAGPIDTRVVRYTFFSQSRFATFQCRLDAAGSRGRWKPCYLGSDIVGALADGTYQFKVRGTDENGQTDPTPDIRTFSISSTGPSVSISGGPPPHTRRRRATFSFSSPVPGVTFQCQMAVYGSDGTWAPCTSPVTYSNLTDGLYVFQAKAVAPGGDETDPPAAWMVNVDQAGPAMVFLTTPASPTKDTSASFAFQPNERVKGSITCQLDGQSAVDCSDGTFNAAGLGVGHHSLAVTASDELGNAGTTNFTWSVDQTGPILTVTGPPVYTNQTSADFTIKANEDLQRPGASCALDGENLVTSAYIIPACRGGGLSLSGLTEGPHTLEVAGADEAGNLASVVTWSWTVDTAPPITTITSGPPNPTPDTTATFEFSAIDQSPVTFTCMLDGVSNPCVSGVTYTGLSIGKHTFKVWAVDAAGNQGLPDKWPWQIVPG